MGAGRGIAGNVMLNSAFDVPDGWTGARLMVLLLRCGPASPGGETKLRSVKKNQDLAVGAAQGQCRRQPRRDRLMDLEIAHAQGSLDRR
jgi:DMSO/TMAO reductase YedYZ molybdopterin-dependent catalytic subunit